MKEQPQREFGPFQLNIAERLLRRDGQIVPLAPKSFDLLVTLTERPGALCAKPDLTSRLWPDVTVEESALMRAVSDLRKVLQQDETSPYIQTVPKFGYRFVCPMREAAEPGLERAKAGPEQPEALAPPVRAAPKNRLAIRTGLALLAIAFTYAAAVYWLPRKGSRPAADGGGVRSAQAQQLSLRAGGECGKRTEAGCEAAITLYRQALELDARDAPAWLGLAEALFMVGGYRHQPQEEMLPKALAAAERARQLDPGLARAAAVLGLITQNQTRDWARAEQFYREAIARAPQDPAAHHWLADMLGVQGRFAESRAEFEAALSLSPLSSIIEADYAQMFSFQRDFRETVIRLKAVLAADPGFLLAQEMLANTYIMSGQPELAYQAAMQTEECESRTEACTDRWLAWLPELGAARAGSALQHLESAGRRGYVPSFTLAVAYVRQHRNKEAIQTLEQMERTHEAGLLPSKVNPLFDPLRSEPRFRNLLRRLKLS